MKKQAILSILSDGLLTLVLLSGLLASNANAALLERLGGLAYYDDQADITWLADANASGTRMTWQDANDWAMNLNVAGVTGWRLADSLQPDLNCSTTNVIGSIPNSSGTNCTGSEMGNLFYNVLGGTADISIHDSHNANYDLFNNIQSIGYWTGTEQEINTARAWTFHFSNGVQANNTKEFTNLFSWAVHTGDVSAVPVPAAVWLLASGLLGLFGFTRYKR